jgi:hypothetical protein
MVLEYRKEVLEEYDRSCKTTRKRIAEIEKLQFTRNISSTSVDSALDALGKAKEEERQAKEAFKTTTELSKQEIERFHVEFVSDFESALDVYVRQQTQAAEQLLECWKSLGI